MGTKNETGYNGWANYPTWNIKLWIDNDQGLLEYFVEEAQQITSKIEVMYKGQTKKQATVHQLSESLKEFFVEENDPLRDQANCYSDLLSSALRTVDWYEIAEAIVEDELEESDFADEECEEEEVEINQSYKGLDLV